MEHLFFDSIDEMRNQTGSHGPNYLRNHTAERDYFSPLSIVTSIQKPQEYLFSNYKPAVNMIKLGDVTVDFSGYTACDENGKIDITPKELEILKVLIDNKGLVLSRNQILDDVWGYDCDVIDRTIDAYIRNIRKKLRLDCITTVKGIGYKFEMGQEI